ncbi:MAG: hypothetical protein ACRYG5_13080 [Janthinobacterium lividum]
MTHRISKVKWHIWRMPLVLNASIVGGLACALLSDGDVWRAIGCLGLGLPVCVACLKMLR